jgi:hypothetical protein
LEFPLSKFDDQCSAECFSCVVHRVQRVKKDAPAKEDTLLVPSARFQVRV